MSIPPPSNRRWIVGFILLLSGLAGISIGLFLGLTRDLPQIRALESYQPSAATRVFSADGVLLAEFYAEKRHPVALAMMPAALKTAVLTTEDRQFYNHSGIDLKGILRAIIRDIRAGEFVEGASTITQQLAKTLFLTPRKSLIRKIREAILAFQLERRYTKDQILELYLNQIYLGSGAYGVDSAARRYFGTSVRNLDLPQCALIAGLPKAPSRYSPLVNLARARDRRNTILQQMVTQGVVEPAAGRAAQQAPIVLAGHAKARQAPYFIDHVKTFLEARIGAERLYRGGLTITTTLSFPLQQAAEAALARGVTTLANRISRPQAALVCVTADTGAIVAMVGGSDYVKSPFNRSTQAHRQPGSAFKPLIYALAIEQGLAPNSLILDAPVVFGGKDRGSDWQPHNFSRTYLGDITLRRALALSRNIPAVRLLRELGPAEVVNFAHALGIESALGSDLSLALGSSEVTLLELAAAYAVFPNQGRRVQPFTVTEVKDRRGRLVWQHRSRETEVMSAAGAAVMVDMLRAAIAEGTGRHALKLQYPLGGKTGTTDQYRDALFVGFSPAMVAAVWVGRDDNRPLGPGETGARAALPIWTDFMAAAVVDSSPRHFDVPADVRRVAIDPHSGHPRAEGSPGASMVLFKAGTEPRLHE